MNWLDLIKLLVPIIISAKVPHGDVIAPFVVNGITEAENLTSSTSGSDKLAHALSLTNIGINAYNAAAPATKQINTTEVNNVISEGISTSVGVANLISGK